MARGRKRAGRDFGTPEHRVERGTLTCTDCNGTGEEDRPQLETDEDGPFAGTAGRKCGTCSGTGKLSTR